MRRCLFRGSLEDSYPPTAIGYAGFLVIRVNPFRILLMSILPHGKQISPDKNVNFPCTTAAFTLPPEPTGFVVLCQLAQGLSLVCGFCPSARTFALRLLDASLGIESYRLRESRCDLQTISHEIALAFG